MTFAIFQQYHIVHLCSIPAFLCAQTGLCSSPVHLPSLAFFWAPEFSFLNAALSLSFTLLILDQFDFVLSGLLWIPVLSVKVLLRPLQPHAVGNLSEAKMYHIHSHPYPPALWPCQRRKFSWFDTICSSQIHAGCFPLCSQNHWPTVNNSAEYFSRCWSSTDCFIIVHVDFIFLSKARYSAFPLG